MGKHALPNFRIAVVGTGAIGGYYGGKFAHRGRDVHFLVRDDVREARRRGLRIRTKSEEIRLAKFNCYNNSEEIGGCDLVLIALKTTSNSDLLHLLPPLLREKTMLVTLQNGLGADEFLAKHFGRERVLGGLCFVSLNRIAPGVIQEYGSGRVVLGEFDGYPLPRTHDLSWEFKRSGIVCSVTEDLARERWRKLVWNIPFNGLAVVAGADTATILSDDKLAATVLELMDEVIAGANACGYALQTAIALELIKRTGAMGAYKPSTLIDFQAGRPLELEAIWGEPLRRAQAAGAHVPRLEWLYATLSEMAPAAVTS